MKSELQKYLDTYESPFTSSKVVTDIRDATVFYKAREDHQEYLSKNPWGYCNHAYRKLDWSKVATV